MPRPTRQQIDEEILDAAAALFARHGVEHTSVQRVADATGYSKTGLLHRFPTKEALAGAALAMTLDHVRRLAGGVAASPPGPARDRAVVAALADLALARPGFTALALSSVSGGAQEQACQLEELAAVLFEAFAAPPDTGPERAVRLTTCLGGLATAALACREHQPAHVVRPLLVAAAVGALGHPADAPTGAPTGA
ncbi:TetR/AcrR family transcriptional regulator [Paenibacillus sp. TRM 82003]|uniref:TetR/AcrR family transcriptional regulator n=1 Tax=Kineococcus sp. TRM81007 TaxID=2925831 RepID=UPI001F5ABCBF|nr:TetR/AcrR family transcriptional regulator [Kineococcus sp. TRM81007]MCI2238730.1 TetR/AcrR family transcriptional regulator [Kineococcus sp. TRM81007]MCI3924136.1 TetR/AcrR family transcriptional regulator [Paenibacillus sp. TRM 82003]